MSWQVQEAKQRFSEVLRATLDEGPQTITRHGMEIAVVIDIDQYRRLAGAPDLKRLLLDGPPFSEDFGEIMDEVIAERKLARTHEFDFGDRA